MLKWAIKRSKYHESIVKLKIVMIPEFVVVNMHYTNFNR